MKRVYLVRHGKAEERGTGDDGDRALTSEGRERMRRTAKAFAKEARPAPEVWLVSPLVRAVQTCEICISAFDQEGPVEVTRALLPETRLSHAVELVERRAEPALVLVGHDPLISALAAHLCGLPAWPGPFKKGMVAAINLDGRGKLAWVLRPAGAGRDPEIA